MVITQSTIQSLDGIYCWSLGLEAGGNMQSLLLCHYKRQVRTLLAVVPEKSQEEAKILQIHNQLPWTHPTKGPEGGNMNETILGILIKWQVKYLKI